MPGQHARGAGAASATARRAVNADRISAGLRSRAADRRGVVAMFAWGVAEALVWPLIPDISLALLVFSLPRRWPALTAATLIGSVTGGALGWAASASGLHWPLPLTTPRMSSAVDAWLAADGAQAMVQQPMSGVPYKVFVAAAPDADVALGPFLVATAQYRGLRMLVAALVVAAVGAVIWRLVPRRLHAEVHLGLTIAGTVVFLAGLVAVFRGWS